MAPAPCSSSAWCVSSCVDCLTPVVQDVEQRCQGLLPAYLADWCGEVRKASFEEPGVSPEGRIFVGDFIICLQVGYFNCVVDLTTPETHGGALDLQLRCILR